MSDGKLEALFEFEKVMNRLPMLESSLAVTTWFAEEARPLRAPMNEFAVMVPASCRFADKGVYVRPGCVPRTVAVLPAAVSENRSR
jgi:hypothetical protein